MTIRTGKSGRRINLHPFMQDAPMEEKEFFKKAQDEGYEVYTEESINEFLKSIRNYGTNEDLEKAKKDFSKLVKRQVQITRNGKRITKTVWVKPYTDDEKKEVAGRKKYGSNSVKVTDEFGADITKQVKVSTDGGKTKVTDEFGADITKRVKVSSADGKSNKEKKEEKRMIKVDSNGDGVLYADVEGAELLTEKTGGVNAGKYSVTFTSYDSEKDRSDALEGKVVIRHTYTRQISPKEFKKLKGDSIVEHNGKKYKKQSNGKWMEVSEQGETKVGHIYQAKYAKEESKKPSLHTSKHEDAERWHRKQASKLSDKEYTDEEVGLG